VLCPGWGLTKMLDRGIIGNMKLTINNYDLNIWDELYQKTSGELLGGWRVDFYKINSEWSDDESHWSFTGFGTGEKNDDLTLFLEEGEDEVLTLGLSTEKNFWTCRDSFISTYKEIPDRIREHLLALPEYDIVCQQYPYGTGSFIGQHTDIH